MPAQPLPGEHRAPAPAPPPRGWLVGMWQAWRWHQGWRTLLGWQFVLLLLLQPRSPPLLLFFRLFFQLFQACCFMVSLFAPPVVQGPVSPAQAASRSLGSTEGCPRADADPRPGHTWGTSSQVWFVSCIDTSWVQPAPAPVAAGSRSGRRLGRVSSLPHAKVILHHRHGGSLSSHPGWAGTQRLSTNPSARGEDGEKQEPPYLPAGWKEAPVRAAAAVLPPSLPPSQ